MEKWGHSTKNRGIPTIMSNFLGEKNATKHHQGGRRVQNVTGHTGGPHHWTWTGKAGDKVYWEVDTLFTSCAEQVGTKNLKEQFRNRRDLTHGPVKKKNKGWGRESKDERGRL